MRFFWVFCVFISILFYTFCYMHSNGIVRTQYSMIIHECVCSFISLLDLFIHIFSNIDSFILIGSVRSNFMTLNFVRYVFANLRVSSCWKFRISFEWVLFLDSLQEWSNNKFLFFFLWFQQLHKIYFYQEFFKKNDLVWIFVCFDLKARAFYISLNHVLNIHFGFGVYITVVILLRLWNRFQVFILLVGKSFGQNKCRSAQPWNYCITVDSQIWKNLGTVKLSI